MNEFTVSYNDSSSSSKLQPSQDVSAHFGGNLIPSLDPSLPLMAPKGRHQVFPKDPPSQSSYHLKETQLATSRPPKSVHVKDDNYVFVTDDFQYLNVATRENMRSDKSYSDLNRSLANLARAPESSSSLEDMIGSKNRNKPPTGRLGPKLPNFQFQPHSNSLSQQQPFTDRREWSRGAKTPQGRNSNISPFAVKHSESERGRESDIPVRKDMGYQMQGNNSKYRPRKLQGEFSNNLEEYHPHSYRDFPQKPLLTEGDSPIGRDDFLDNRLSEDLMNKVEEQERIRASRESMRNNVRVPSAMMKRESGRIGETGKKLQFEKQNVEYNGNFSKFAPVFKSQNGSKSSQRGSNGSTFLRKNYTSQTEVKDQGFIGENSHSNEQYENHEVLDLNGISDGVQYGYGGVGYSAEGKRKHREEGRERGESRNGGQRSMERKGMSTGRGSRIIGVSKGALDTWKKDILNIKKDIEKRKKSYDRVNKFLKMCDTEREFLPKADVQRFQSTSSNVISPYSRQTLHTMPAYQERSTSPNISPLLTNPSFPQKGTHNTSNFSYRDKSIENLQRRDDRDTRYFLDIRTTDEGEEHRFMREDQTTQENHSRIRTVPSRHEFQTCELSAGSFVNGNTGCKKCYRSPCCGTNSGCQIF